MSLNFDERKFFFKNDYNNNLRQNNSKNTKKTLKNTYTGISKDHFNNYNNSSQNNKIMYPNLIDILNTKSKIIPNQPNRNQNIPSIQYNLFTKKMRKKKNDNYKHNKSFEENSLNNNILLQYKIESPLIPGNTDNCGNEIIEILNLNGNTNNNNSNNNNNNNNNNYNINNFNSNSNYNQNKKSKKKNLNNSYILQSKYKNMITEGNYENRNNNNKINEYITDYKKYTYKNNFNKKQNKDFLDKGIDRKELIIGENDKNSNSDFKTDDIAINQINNDNDDFINDEYLLNSSFENNKSDFSLLYTNNYHKRIKNDMLYMEIQLLFEKILDLQNSYHHEFKRLYTNYEIQKNILKTVNENNIFLKKKLIILLMLKEKRKMKENNNIYIDFNNKKNIVNDSSNININEISIWNKMFPIRERIDEKNNKKYILKQIFKNIVFDRYKSINYKLNDIERNIISSLYKKYQSNNKLSSNNKKSYNNKNTKKFNIYNLNSNNMKVNNKNIKKSNGLSFNKNNVGNNYKYSARNKVY